MNTSTANSALSPLLSLTLSPERILKRFIKPKWLAGVVALVWAAMLVTSPGCSHNPISSLQQTDAHLTNIDGERKAAQSDLTIASGKSQGEVKERIVSAQVHLDDKHQGKEIAAARASNKQAAVDVGGIQTKLDRYEKDHLVQGVLWLERAFWAVLISAAIVGALLITARFWGKYQVGWIGWISNALLGLVTLGVGPLMKLADKKAMAKTAKASSSKTASSHFAGFDMSR